MSIFIMHKWRLVAEKNEEVEEKPTHCMVIFYALPTFLYFFMIKVKLSSKIMSWSFGNMDFVSCFLIQRGKRKSENIKT